MPAWTMDPGVHVGVVLSLHRVWTKSDPDLNTTAAPHRFIPYSHRQRCRREEAFF